MPPKSQFPSVRQGRRQPKGQRTNPKLEQLRRRFEHFREVRSPGSRIPVALQKAVVAAIRDGITRSAVEKNCRVSWSQTERWLVEHGSPKLSPAQEPTRAARVFSVVDNVPALPIEPAPEQVQHGLELRLDGWSISIRRVES